MFKTLIVEDGAIFRELLHETLHSRFPSMEIQEAKDGKEAFKTIEALVPDFIFIDIQLPGENGLELAKKVKSIHPDMTVIILTNYDLPEYREAASRCKVDHFIPKDSFMAMANLLFPHQRPNQDGFRSK